jgi:hypothetical protein
MYRVRFANVTDRRLGRHVNHDPRSRRYPIRRAAPLTSIRHARHVPVFDQGELGSCTGNAAVGCMGTGAFFATLTGRATEYFEDEAGAVRCYGDATAIDSYPGVYPPTDTGSDGLSVAKALKARGEISGYEHAFSLDQALRGLMDRPQITGTNWTTGMFDPDRDGIIHPTGTLAGGHEFVMDEYDQARGLVGFTNSWGPGWGLAGRFFMQAEEYGTLLEQDGDVTSFVPITAPPPTPAPGPVDAVDAELWSKVGAWATKDGVCARSKRRALVAWATAKVL